MTARKASPSASFATLLELDRVLVKKGHLPLTPWWKHTLERFYNHPTARTLVARVGRGGAKSHTSVKISINETLFGNWKVPSGEVHFWAYVSTGKDEAAQRLRLIERFLLDLGVKFDRTGDEILLRDKPRGFRVFAAQVGAVSGFRCIGYSADELAKWKSTDVFANPAEEVCASLVSMAATHPNFRSLKISSPVGHHDYHAECFSLGDTESQIVVQAASWEANPEGITEERTRKDQPDPRIWAREYAAIPQEAKLAAFDSDAIARAFVAPSVVGRPRGLVGIIDASSGKKDSWTWAICGWRDVDGMRKLVFERVDGFGGAFWDQLAGENIVGQVSGEFKEAGIYMVHGDQRESLMVASAFSRHGLKFKEHAWGNANKEKAVATVRRWLAEGRLVLPVNASKLKAELASFEERTTSSGAFTFGARGSGHDDYVSLIITAAIADSERCLPGSPSKANGMLEALNLSIERERIEQQFRALGKR